MEDSICKRKINDGGEVIEVEGGHPIDNGVGESAAEEFTAHEASEESNKYKAFDYREPSCGETTAGNFVGDDGSDGACEACVDGCRDE